MKLPKGKISGTELDNLFKDSIEYHLTTYRDTIAEYNPELLYSHWRSIVRAIDEIINIPIELKDENEINDFLSLNFNFLQESNLPKLKKVLMNLESRFEKNVAIRFQQLAMMCFAIDSSYQSQGIFNQQGNDLRLTDTSSAISYLQSRRAYYVTTLNLIPKVAFGKKTIPFIDTLNFLQYTMDSCLINITTAYYNLLLNHCLPDFEIDSDGIIAKRNFEYNHLEGFFLEPERLSLLDQMELRPDIVVSKTMIPKADNKLFSFSEVANAMSLFEGAFDKYNIKDKQEFKELNSLFYDIAPYLQNDFHVVIEEANFKIIANKHKSINLYLESDDYFENLNNYAPFQKVDGKYFTTVVLLTRLVYRTLSQSLLKNRTFQINSGFVFEDKASKILEEKGYAPTGITRINHKEFDLITIKDGEVYNFQCKNNYIDISRVNYDYKKIGRFNKRLCRYYEKALIKEEKRESLIKSKTGIDKITHFVISRFPVITRNERIINLTDLENWNPK
tara:strand:- start:643 stop:2154 length:1512 start_codon:yes stop_codon:yes gene_type:complete